MRRGIFALRRALKAGFVFGLDVAPQIILKMALLSREGAWSKLSHAR
jgi:lipid-binding SYLF domain-containing protein